VSTAGVALTIAALGAAVVLPEAVIPVAFGAGILGTSMKVSTVYPDRSSTAVSPIICSKALENSAGSGVSTAGVALTIAALGAAVVLPEAVIPVAFGSRSAIAKKPSRLRTSTRYENALDTKRAF
jgi:hypothetical protein